MTKAQLNAQVNEVFGEDKGRRVVDAFQNGHPTANPFQLWSIIAANSVRGAAIRQARMKSAQGGAPGYLYWFHWQTPILDGRPMAFHCADLSFCWDNADVCETMTGNGPMARSLAAKMSQAWINFAKTGDPNHAGVPKWPALSGTSVPTMIFNDTCLVKDYPDHAEQDAIEA